MTTIDAKKLTVLRVRHNKSWCPEHSDLSIALKTIRNNEYIEAPYIPEESVQDLLLNIKGALSRGRVPYAYVAYDRVTPNFDALLGVIEQMEREGTPYQTIGVAIHSSSDNSQIGTIFCGNKNTLSYPEISKILTLNKFPFLLLSGCIFKAAALMEILDKAIAKQFSSCAELSEYLWQTFNQATPVSSPSIVTSSFGANQYVTLAQELLTQLKPVAATPSVKVRPPIVTLTPIATPSESIEIATHSLESNKHQKALDLLDEADALGDSNPEALYLRAFALIKLGRLIEARECARAQLVQTPQHRGAKQIFDILETELPDLRSFEYQQVESSIMAIPGYLVPGQEKYLFEKARSLPDTSVVVELGPWIGHSTIAICYGLLGTKSRIYCIDTFTGNDGIMGRTDDHLEIFSANMKRQQMLGRVTPLRGYTDQIMAQWDPSIKIDFAFIDASHEYKDVRRDFELVYPHVKEGGWIAFHDVEPSWPGSWRAWRELGVPLLADHQVCSTLTCGRKVSGRAWATPAEGQFSYAQHFIQVIREERRGLETIAAALEVSRAPQQFDENALKSAEWVISILPDFVANEIKNMCIKENDIDGIVHYWYGLILERRGDCTSAQLHFNKALSNPYPVDQRRVALHVNQQPESQHA